jgi:hypothetical protein
VRELHILAFPYWGHIWIVQEIAVAQSNLLICGADLISLFNFAALVSMAIEEGSPEECDYIGIHHPIFELEATTHMYSISGSTCLRMALTFTHGDIARGSRDRIYAVLGLINDGKGHQIEADYTMSACNV